MPNDLRHRTVPAINPTRPPLLLPPRRPPQALAPPVSPPSYTHSHSETSPRHVFSNPSYTHPVIAMLSTQAPVLPPHIHSIHAIYTDLPASSRRAAGVPFLAARLAPASAPAPASHTYTPAQPSPYPRALSPAPRTPVVLSPARRSPAPRVLEQKPSSGAPPHAPFVLPLSQQAQTQTQTQPPRFTRPRSASFILPAPPRFARAPSVVAGAATDVRWSRFGDRNFSTIDYAALAARPCPQPVPDWGYPRADLLR